MDEIELRYANEEDTSLFWELIHGLPDFRGVHGNGLDDLGKAIPTGIGPHSIRCLRKVCEIVEPRNILEIGFNLGYSASVWLHFTDATLTSVDNGDRSELFEAAKVLKKRYPQRFEFIHKDSQEVYKTIMGSKFDLIFIDGDHTEAGVTHDIGLAGQLKIPYLCFDDYLPKYGPGTQPSIKKFPLQIIEVMGNIALAKMIYETDFGLKRWKRK